MCLPKWSRGYDWNLIRKISARHKLDPDLVAAVIQTESSGNTYAVQYEPKWKYRYQIFKLSRMLKCKTTTMINIQKNSWGLMQCMGTVAYENGLGTRRARRERWCTSLLTPSIGIEYGCRVLAKKYKRYGPDVERVVAAYNSGKPRFKADGSFENQKHVDRFLRYYRALKREQDGT